MKPRTIRQHLQTMLLVLVVLLLTGVGLALWVESEYSNAKLDNERLLRAKADIYTDLLSMGEALRGLSTDLKDDWERRRLSTWLKTAGDDLESELLSLDTTFRKFPDLMNTVRDVRDFAFGNSPATLGHFRSRILELAEKDSVSAVAYFNANYPALSKQRDSILRELTNRIQTLNSSKSVHAQNVSVIGVVCLAFLLLASLVVGRFQSAAIAEPLNRLVATLERMRQGDFSHRLALPRQDEFGLVGQGLNRLADDLCQLVGQVQRSGIQVNTTATQIAATAKEQQSTAHEIAATTAQIGATSKEISATSKELVKTMNEVNQVAEATAHLAGSGQAAIARMETTMRQIMEAAGSITAKLAVLSEKTTNINSVVTTITKVADQTNLLSLNAAIEAEKAGEYGLGFAVVAMEIRRLADQTAVATYDIEKMVKEMQTAVASGVMGMDKFSEEVRRGVEEVRQVSTHLAQIINQVQTLSPRFQTVNEGMHAQATGAQQISDTLIQLSEAAQQTAESLRQSNLAIEQLNGAARGLQTSVARFKLTNGQPNGEPAPNDPGLGL
jgi:methyl-accepting chemotaxis protein WspA